MERLHSHTLANDLSDAQEDATNARAIAWAHGLTMEARPLQGADWTQANNADAFTRLCVTALARMVERAEQRAARATGVGANDPSPTDAAARDFAEARSGSLDREAA